MSSGGGGGGGGGGRSRPQAENGTAASQFAARCLNIVSGASAGGQRLLRNATRAVAGSTFKRYQQDGWDIDFIFGMRNIAMVAPPAAGPVVGPWHNPADQLARFLNGQDLSPLRGKCVLCVDLCSGGWRGQVMEDAGLNCKVANFACNSPITPVPTLQLLAICVAAINAHTSGGQDDKSAAVVWCDSTRRQSLLVLVCCLLLQSLYSDVEKAEEKMVAWCGGGALTPGQRRYAGYYRDGLPPREEQQRRRFEPPPCKALLVSAVKLIDIPAEIVAKLELRLEIVSCQAVFKDGQVNSGQAEIVIKPVFTTGSEGAIPKGEKEKFPSRGGPLMLNIPCTETPVRDDFCVVLSGTNSFRRRIQLFTLPLHSTHLSTCFDEVEGEVSFKVDQLDVGSEDLGNLSVTLHLRNGPDSNPEKITHDGDFMVIHPPESGCHQQCGPPALTASAAQHGDEHARSAMQSSWLAAAGDRLTAAGGRAREILAETSPWLSDWLHESAMSGGGRAHEEEGTGQSTLEELCRGSTDLADAVQAELVELQAEEALGSVTEESDLDAPDVLHEQSVATAAS